jgi:iron complex outermembrane receptor protein
MTIISKSVVINSLLFILVAFGACRLGLTQAVSGIHGIVSDPSGAHVPNANLTFTQADSKFIKTVQSDVAGNYNISLPAGSYQLEATANGFRTMVIRNVVVADKQSTATDVRLLVNGATEVVSVVGVPGALESFETKQVSMGPLGDIAELDTPYSVNTIPGSVIESQHITTLADLVKYIPSAQFEQRFGLNVGRLQTRGFQSSVFQNVLVNGMYLSSTTQFPLQEYDRVDVTNGLTSGLYGPANPSGTFDFILKRPTETRTETVGSDYDDMGVRTFRGDFGGTIGPKKIFGYRVNLLEGNGTSWVDKSRVRQDMESGDFDLHLAKHTVLELNYAHSQYFQTGFPGSFSYATKIKLPKAPDPTRPGLGQPFAGFEVSETLFIAQLKHEISRNFRVLAGVGSQTAPREMLTVGNTITSNAGAYTAKISPTFNKGTVRSATLYFNGEEKTGKIEHRLVLGARAYSSLNYGALTSGTAGSITLATGATIYNPSVATNVPKITKHSGSYKSGIQGQETLIMGDSATLGRWTAAFTGSQNWMFARTYTTAGVLAATNSTYYQTAFTPSTSLAYKPAPNMTSYFAYSTSVVAGDSTGTSTTTTVNPNTYLSPITTTQYEAGYKVQLSQLELTTALFHIDRPYAYAAATNQAYKVQGDQVNRGLELTAKGKATRDLNLFGGLTWLDPRMRNTVNAAAEGKQYPGAPRVQLNMLGEYQLSPIHALREMAVNMNYHYMGHRAANEANSYWIDGYSAIDFGTHYSHKFEGTVVTGRFGVANVTNKAYWASIMPGSQTGATTTTSSDTANLGAPRTYNFSLLFTLR